MTEITPKPIQEAALLMRQLLAAYRDHEDLISIGAYRRGANRQVDAAIEMLDEINAFLQQKIDEKVSLTQVQEGLLALGKKIQARLNTPTTQQVIPFVSNNYGPISISTGDTPPNGIADRDERRAQLAVCPTCCRNRAGNASTRSTWNCVVCD